MAVFSGWGAGKEDEPAWQGQAVGRAFGERQPSGPQPDVVRRWGKAGGTPGRRPVVASPTFPPTCILGTRGRAGNSHPSGAPKADAELLTLHQDRHLAVALSEAQHLGHSLGILFDIPINDRQPFFSLGLPGPPRKGSRLLPEDGDLSGYCPPPEEVSR